MPAVDDDDVVRLRGLLHVVRRQEHRQPRLPLKRLHAVPDALPRLRVEPGRRLVEEQQLRRIDQRARDVRPAPLPAGELPVRPLQKIPGVRRARRPANRLGKLRARLFVEPAPRAHVLLDRQKRVEQVILKHDADRRANRRVVLSQPMAVERDLARVRLQDRAEYVDRRRLARAVRPEKREQLAAIQVEVDAVDRPHRPVRLLQPLDLEDFLHALTPKLSTLYHAAPRRTRNAGALLIRSALKRTADAEAPLRIGAA